MQNGNTIEVHHAVVRLCKAREGVTNIARLYTLYKGVLGNAERRCIMVRLVIVKMC